METPLHVRYYTNREIVVGQNDPHTHSYFLSNPKLYHSVKNELHCRHRVRRQLMKPLLEQAWRGTEKVDELRDSMLWPGTKWLLQYNPTFTL